jgi:ribA/ribD-fused uncharacterized protein
VDFFILYHIIDMSYINSFRGRFVFLSNFYPCKIEHKGINYPSVEHYYVALKVTGMQFIDGVYYTAPDFRELIARILDAGDVKKLGRRVKVRSDWGEKKLEFMEWGVREKFKDPKLGEMLLDTDNLELIEGNNWHDVFWGKCSCPKCNGSGENHLGKILMKIREELKQQNSRPSLEEQIKNQIKK